MSQRSSDRLGVVPWLASAVVLGCVALLHGAAAEEDQARRKQPAEIVAVDAPGTKTAIYRLEHAKAESVVKALRERLSASAAESVRVALTSDEKTNGVIVSGSAAAHAQMAKLIAELDVPPEEDRRVTVYRLKYAGGGTVLSVLQTMDPAAKLVFDEASNSLLVAGSPSAHERAEQLIQLLDVPPARDHAQRGQIEVYQLAHVHALYALRILNSLLLLPEPTEARYSADAVRIDADPDNNRILVSGTPEVHAQVQEILKKLDVPPERGRGLQVQVFQVTRADAKGIAETVSEFLHDEDVSISVDPRTNSILAKGPEASLTMIEALILRFDRDQSQTSAIRVRVVWLASGLPADAGTEPAEDLKPVLAELAAVGVTDLRQVGQAMVNTMPDRPFQMSCLPRYDKGPAEMRLDGVFQDKGGRPMMDIQISAKQIVTVPDPRMLPDSRDKFGTKYEGLVTLDTQITASYGHYVVLGVTPVEKANSVFVAQVTPSK